MRKFLLFVVLLILSWYLWETVSASIGEIELPTSNQQNRSEVNFVSEIEFKASGGRSPVQEYGIVLREYPKEIVLRVFKVWWRGEQTLDKEVTISKEEYETFWEQVNRLGVWELGDQFFSPYSDGFTHEFVFVKNGKSKKLVSLNPEGPVWELINLLDDLCIQKLGVSLYNRK